ncbi:MAG: sugar-binding protein [Aurantibacter sp.]
MIQKPQSSLGLSVPFWEKEIKVDGVIDEGAWEQVSLIEKLVSPWDKDGSDKTKFRAFVSTNYFNFCFQVEDNTLITVPFEKELSVASEDRIELFFSNDTTLAKYYCIEIDPKGNVLDYSAKYYRDFSENWNFKSKKAATKITDTGYTVEGKISLKELNELGVSNPFYLVIFRGDFKRPKLDDVTWFSWIIPSSSQPDFHIPSTFGKILLKQ